MANRISPVAVGIAGTVVVVGLSFALERTWMRSVLQALSAGVAFYVIGRAIISKEPEGVDPVTETPPEPPKRLVVVAFDFDKCLMKDHWFGTHRYNAIDTINPLAKDFALKNAPAFFERLVNIPHVRVAVASFGRKDVITKAINSVLPPHLAAKVYITTPGDFPHTRDGTGLPDKNRQLERVSEKFGVHLSRIIFFDDDAKNISAANNIGVNAVFSAPFNDNHLQTVSAFVGVDMSA